MCCQKRTAPQTIHSVRSCRTFPNLYKAQQSNVSLVFVCWANWLSKLITWMRWLNFIFISKIFNLNQNLIWKKIEISRSITRHRKISSSFRDTQLLEIFTLACNLLKQANENIKIIFGTTDRNSMPERELVSHLLQLSLNCLLYDFIGTTSNEDTSDDLSTVQIPTTWRTSNLTLSIFCFNYVN